MCGLAQPCLQVQCPTNKTVQCGSTWTFDQPTATTCCTTGIVTSTGVVTNVLVTSTGVVTNGACPKLIITQTWQIIDGCGDSANCSQTVTVLGCCPTNCLQVQCPTNKTVQCGSTWTFDQPVISTCCTNQIQTPTGLLTNVLVTSTGLVTNGACPQLTITETWQISDGCGSSTNCSQTVTVAGCCPTNCLQVQCPTNKRVPCGTTWTFDPPLVSTCCTNLIQTSPGVLTNVLITPTGLVTNGACPQLTITETWQISDGCGASTNCSQTVTVAGCCPTNCLQVQCSTNKTVQCGSTWTFDRPTVSTCCTSNVAGVQTNVLIIPTGLVTNGACPQLAITRTWQIIDGCGDSTNCSQTVTVLGCCPTNCLQVICPTNKTVQCGSTWTFDLPIASSCCTNLLDPPSGILTNVLITSTSLVPNGVCPKLITQTWRIFDGCGDTNTCSQTVTVVDTTPPVIHCPTNIVVVALNANCQLVIPPISVTATDNCTPLCSLIYTQSPPAGTIVAGTFACVTVTVTDLCGNSNSCVVCVQGLPRTGPVVTCPATMTVTNCTVPCVPVTATDNCCPQKSLVITQSPPCGTPIGPGITSITVTVRDCHGNVTTKVVHLIIGPAQSFLSNLTNTGVGPGGVLLADAVVDPYYSLPPTAVPGGMPADYFGNAVAVSDICHATGTACAWLNGYVKYTCYEYTPWSLPPDAAYTLAASKWIAPDYTNNGCCPGGTYTYTLNFVLPAGYNPAMATISGRWAADNAASMKLNGVPVPGATPGISSWTPFTIPAGGGFISGANSLKFTVTNVTVWTGMRVEFTGAHANCFTCAPPFIVWGSPSQSLPVGSTATFSVTAGGTPPLSYQWSHNNVNLPGANNSLLQISPIGFADAGLYTVVIANPCGVVTWNFRLNVTSRWWWQWGWWNVQTLARPLAASVGPDLSLVGSDFAASYGVNAGSTEDFGLPAPGGQVVNVMDINPHAGASIQVPPITASGTASNASYTLIMDVYEPDTSWGTPSTLFQSIACCISNLTSGGQDGVALTLDASNYLHIAGSAGGVPFDTASAAPMAVDTWNRVALVVDNPPEGGTVTLSAIINVTNIIIIHPCICCIIPFTASTINWAVSPPTLFSVQPNADGPNGEFYVSSIQFHNIALSSDMIDGIGTPDNGPAPGNQTSAGTPPVLSAAMVSGAVHLTWAGSPYALQETSDLSSGVWENSALPFMEAADTTGNIMTTAVVTPTPGARSKFYRLIFNP
jgi:hypothetical protein